MTIQVINAKAQVTKIKAWGKQTANVSVVGHQLACESLLHCRDHGDTTLIQMMYDVCHVGVRREELKEWFFNMSGQQIIAKKGGVWGLKKDWSADKFDMQKAEDHPFYEKAEKVSKPLSFAAFMEYLTKFGSKVDKADKEGNFNGDAAKIKAVVGQIVDFAQVQSARLTKQELGVLGDQADKILKDGEVVNKPAPVPAAIVAAQDDGVNHDQGTAIEPLFSSEEVAA